MGSTHELPDVNKVLLELVVTTGVMSKRRPLLSLLQPVGEMGVCK